MSNAHHLYIVALLAPPGGATNPLLAGVGAPVDMALPVVLEGIDASGRLRRLECAIKSATPCGNRVIVSVPQRLDSTMRGGPCYQGADLVGILCQAVEEQE